jgi:predicted transcriptional regulator
MAGETNPNRVNQSLVTKIVTKYLAHHQLTPEQLPGLIVSVHHTLNSLGQVAAPPPVLTPAVPVRRSVQRNAVVCLDCGWTGKMLRRHLPTDHPLTAPMYSEQRSVLAKELGLGRGGRTG